MAELTGNDQATERLLRRTQTIAVVGASEDPRRDSNKIFSYLRGKGYDVVPVNPKAAMVAGVRAVPDLVYATDVLGGLDMVNVFRRGDALPGIVEEAVELDARALWGQLTVAHPDARKLALDNGIDYIEDRCIKIEHGRLI